MSALAQPTRLKVFLILSRAGAEGITSGELANRTGAAATTMSAHLAVLTRASLVTAEKNRKNVVHRAVPETVFVLAEFLLSLNRLVLL